MELKHAIAAYLSALRLQGGTEHQDQANIVLWRAADWMSKEHPHLKPAYSPVLHLSDLSTRAITEFLAWRKTCPGLRAGTTLSPFTLGKEARYLRSFVNHVVADPSTYELPPGWLIPTVPRIREPKVIPKPLEEPDLDRAFDACQHATLPVIAGVTPAQWWFTLLYLAYLTAMRRRALFSIPRPYDHDLDRRLLFMPATSSKSGEDRYFPLTDVACRLIRAMPSQPGDPLFVWVGRDGSRDYRSFYTHFERMQRQAGIVGPQQSRLHVLRKTALTYMARAGVGMATVQQHAGHSDPGTTAKYYLGTMSEPQKDAVEQLPTPKRIKERFGDPRQRKLFD